MNPYTYKRRRRKHSTTAAIALGGTIAFAREVLGAPLASSIAIAMLLFAAGSVASVGLYADAALDASNYVAFESPRTVALGERSHSAVLGISTSLMPVETTTIIAVPNMFDEVSGKWDYKIDYQLADSLQIEEGSVTVGSVVLSDAASSSDMLATDFVLKPGSRYEIAVWSKPGRGGEKVASMVFVTPSAPTTPLALF